MAGQIQDLRGQPDTAAAGGFYRRSDVARQLHVSLRTLRRYEAFGLVQPVRAGGQLLYRAEDLARLRKIRRLTEDLGVNLAGVEIILRLIERLEEHAGASP
jgi:MerR family transcriptional regulator/heat shock protein HspR